MRSVVLMAVVVVSAMGGVLLARAGGGGSTPTPVSVSREPAAAGVSPASLVGRQVRVYFRKSDELPFAVPGEGKINVNYNAKLTHLGGKVLEAQPGWITLESKDHPGRAAAWIPSTSVGYILLDEAADAPPANRP